MLSVICDRARIVNTLNFIYKFFNLSGQRETILLPIQKLKNIVLVCFKNMQ